MISDGGAFKNISYEEEIKRAKWYKEDLSQGGWTKLLENEDVSFWAKEFPGQNVPTKILFTFNMPMAAEDFLQLLHPNNQSLRNIWDKSFVDHAILEELDDGGHITYLKAKTSWPLSDRAFVLHLPPIKEIDWYGRRSLILIQKNAEHLSKPEDVRNYVVRATNGGNFFIATQDEHENQKCTVFGLTNNNFNGWIPKNRFRFFVREAVVKSFRRLREGMIVGYLKYLKNENK